MDKLKIKQVAEILNLHYTKIYKLISSGDLKAINVGTGNERPTWRVTKESLDEFMRQRGNKEVSER